MYSTIKKVALWGCISVGLSMSGYGMALAAYPDKPVKIVVNFPAGGDSDLTARIFAEYASKQSGQPIIIENKPGASGIVGGQYVARQKADGYNLLMGINILHTVHPHVHKKMSFSPTEDLVAIGNMGTFNLALLTSGKGDLHSLEDLMAKAEKQGVFYSSAGLASPGHLAMEVLSLKTDLDSEHAPYAGNAVAAQAIMRGDVDAGFLAIGANYPMIASGDLRVLAVSGAERHPQLDSVPTLQESGIESLTDFDVEFGFVLMAPSQTDTEILDYWSNMINQAFSDPQVQQRLGALYLDLAPSTPEQTQAYLQKEHEAWGEVIQRAAISID